MKKSYVIIIAILLLAGLLTAFEHGMEKCPEGKLGITEKFEKKQGDGMMMMAEELELTSTQVETIHELQMENKKFMIRAKADIDILMLDKKAALKDKDFVEAKKITERIFQKKQQMALKRIDIQEDRWNILTEEQKLKAEELKMEKAHSSHKMHEGKGRKQGM
jgi:LTXXQ motif family protein